MTKVVAINSSPRKKGNTSILIDEVFKVLNGHHIETEEIRIGNKAVHGCTACEKCGEIRDGHCHIKNDLLNSCIDKMTEADGILLGSPVYFSDVNTEMKALIDVAGYVAKANGSAFVRKVGVGVVAVRRAGALHALASMNNFFLISQCIIPGSYYWNSVFGRKPGDVRTDNEGIENIQRLGENMAWLLDKIG